MLDGSRFRSKSGRMKNCIEGLMGVFGLSCKLGACQPNGTNVYVGEFKPGDINIGIGNELIGGLTLKVA